MFGISSGLYAACQAHWHHPENAQLTMEETWNIDKAKVVLLWARYFNLENIAGESLRNLVEICNCARESHANSGLFVISHGHQKSRIGG